LRFGLQFGLNAHPLAPNMVLLRLIIFAFGLPAPQNWRVLNSSP
jgi:hypothetical protein